MSLVNLFFGSSFSMSEFMLSGSGVLGTSLSRRPATSRGVARFIWPDPLILVSVITSEPILFGWNTDSRYRTKILAW